MVFTTSSEEGNEINFINVKNSVDPVDTGGFTRIGRCYTSEEVKRKRKGKAKKRELIKEKCIETLAPKASEKNKPITEGEAKEFLKLVKHNEYSIFE